MDFEIWKPFINIGAIGVIAFIMVRQSIKQNNFLVSSAKEQNEFFVREMKKVSEQITRIANNIDKTTIDNNKAMIIFNAVMSEHITEKLKYLKEVLIQNNIKKRREQIQRNVRSEVLQITQREAGRLGNFALHSGYSLDTPLLAVDMDAFLEDVYDLLFEEEPDVLKKISDLRQMMEGYVNDLRIELRKNF